MFNINFTCKQLADSFIDKYIKSIESIGYKTYNELFAIFDIIMEKYNQTNKCPICDIGKGQYTYNEAFIACKDGFFCVFNGIVHMGMRANYCPVCGKDIKDKK